MRKLFILSVLTLGLLSMRSQNDLSKLKEGMWQLYVFPERDGVTIPNGLYSFLEINIEGDIANITTSTVRSDNTYGDESLHLKLNEPFVSKSPSGRKVITVLSYNEDKKAFILDRKYYTQSDESVLELTMYEELWYDENGELEMSRKSKAWVTDYGARDYDYKGKYRKVRRVKQE